MNDNTTLLVSWLAAILSVGSAVFAILNIRRRGRAHRSQVTWLEDRARLDLVAVADLADKYHRDGREHPGTDAVRTMYPEFDFTMGGRYERPAHQTQPPTNG